MNSTVTCVSVMDFETFIMEFEIKDEVKDEVVDDEAQDAAVAVDDADPELKPKEERIDAQNLFCPSPPQPAHTFNAVEFNPIIITPDFVTEDNIQNRLNNSISKSRLICPNCPKSFPTSKALEKHSLNLHGAERDKRLELSCFTCAGRKFADQKSRDEHIKQYHISNVSVQLSRDRSLVEFPPCTRFFVANKKYNNSAHVESEHTDDPIETDPLATATTTPSVQTKLKVSTTRHKCPNCPSTFSRNRNLQQHIIKLHVKHKAFPCHICRTLNNIEEVENFVDQQSLEQHIGSCHVLDQTSASKPAPALESIKLLAKCPHCGKTFSQKRLLTGHIKRVHSGPRLRVQCAQCPSTFTRNQSLQHHIRICHKKEGSVGSGTHDTETEPGVMAEPKQCLPCGKTFSQKRLLTGHIKRVHSGPRLRVQCPQCPSTFTRNQSLQHHIRICHKKEGSDTHDSETEPGVMAEPKECRPCGKTFSQKRLLTRHIKRLHSGPRLRVQCPQCPSTFTRNQSLQHHIRICHKKEGSVGSDTHDSETEPGVMGEPKKCRPCGKTFSAVKSHCAIPIKRSPKTKQRCLHCSLTLSSSSALKMHVLRFHERHKAFPCLTCKSRKTSRARAPVFPTQGKLSRHMRLYHDPASLQKCPRCDKGFPRSTDLKYHILLKHLNISRSKLKYHLRDTKYTLDNLLKEQMLEKQNSIVAEKRTRKSQIGGTKNQCRYCNKVFLNSGELRSHIIEIHVKQNKTAVEKEALQNHANERKGDCNNESEIETSAKNQCEPSRRVRCPKCSSSFSNSKHLQFHIMLQHFENEEFPCLICTSRDQEGSSNPKADTGMKRENFIFQNEYSLNQHMKSMHFSTHKQNTNLQEAGNGPILIPKNKICPICSKSFDGKYAASNYRSHMETHLGIKRYSCEHCSKKYATKISLHLHLIRYHNYTSEQLNFKYACHLCPFITTTQLKLNHHVGVKHPNSNSNDGLQPGEEMGGETTNESNQSSRKTTNAKSLTESAVCFVCSKFQTNKGNLIKHLKGHRGEGRFYCDLCPRDYSVRMLIMIHLKMDHHKLAYCNKCFTSFTDAAAFNQHILQVDVPALNSNQTIDDEASEGCNSPTSDLRCEICSDSFKSPCLLKTHTIAHQKEIHEQGLSFSHVAEVPSADNAFECGLCPSAFDRQSYLNAHLEIVHNHELENTLFKCGKCERSYKFINELKYHDIMVHCPKINQHINQKHSTDASKGEFSFNCDVCATQFETLSELKNHQDKFRSEALCHICPAKFICKSYLETHIRRVHNKVKYNTRSRRSQFDSQSSGRDLQRQVNKMQESKYKDSLDFLCHICPLKFSRDQDLRRHVDKIHEGNYKISRDILCHICPCKFSRNQDLKRHLERTHRGGKSSTSVNVNTENNLLPHKSDETIRSDAKKKSNNKDGRFSCKLCPSVYRNKINLLLHISDHHTDVALKPFECSICHRKFNADNILKVHMVIFHRHVPPYNYRCEVCSVTIRTRIRLIQHLKDEHGRPEYCKTCKRAFETKVDFDEHSERNPSGNFSCDTCHTNCPSQCLLSKHYNQQKHSST